MKYEPLPKKIHHDEATFGLRFRKYIQKLKPGYNAWYELKDSRGKDSLSFSELSEDQILKAKEVREGGALIRATVATPGTADYLWLQDTNTYVVINYPKVWVMILTETFMREKNKSKRRSLTSKRAEEIAYLSVKKTAK